MKHSYRKSQFLRTVNHLFLWAIFHSYVSLPRGYYIDQQSWPSCQINISEWYIITYDKNDDNNDLNLKTRYIDNKTENNYRPNEQHA